MLNYFLINLIIILKSVKNLYVYFSIQMYLFFTFWINSFIYLFIYILSHFSFIKQRRHFLFSNVFFFLKLEIIFKLILKHCFHSFLLLFFNFIIYFFMHLELRHLCNPFENKSKLRVFSHMYSIS